MNRLHNLKERVATYAIPKKEDDMKTWKQLEAIAKRQGMSLDIRSTFVAIDGNKGANELFAVSCDCLEEGSSLFRLVVEMALKELGTP